MRRPERQKIRSGVRHKTDARGSIVGDLIDDLNLTVLNTGCGTRLNNNGPYIALSSSNLSAKFNWTVIDDCWGSDHLPTCVIFNEEPIQENYILPKFNFRKAEWSRFKQICKETICEDILCDDINRSCERVTDAILASAKKCIPESKKRNKRMLPYWNTRCTEAVQRKRKAKRKMDHVNTLNECIEYRKSKAECQRIIRETQTSHWRDYCSSINSSTKLGNIWKTLKSMSGIKSCQQIPNIKDGATILLTNEDKANVFARDIVSSSSDANYNPTFRERKLAFKRGEFMRVPNDKLPGDERMNDPFEAQELFNAIRQCKLNSSSGDDSISYIMFKHMSRTSLQTILALFNDIWRSGSVPSSWKHSIIIPILKPGKEPSLTSSYRPISLTSALCKLNERIIANRLSWYMEKNRIFNTDQSGFRTRRSTIDHILRLQHDINRFIQHREYTVGVFLDFTKAFDMLWKEGLLIKLRHLKISGNLYNWIESFLSDRTIQVRIGESLSNKLILENGTPQGSVLSPLIFLLMINDIPDMTRGASKAVFADDCAIWKSGGRLENLISDLQKNLDKIQTWCNTWGFMLSQEKSVAIIFSRREDQPTDQFRIDGRPLKWQQQVKFLGMVFDERLTWRAHIDFVIDKCKKRLNLMRCIGGTNWGQTNQLN